MTDFGQGMQVVTDMSLGQPMAFGNLIVGQALARRLETPLGGLIDDPNYGYYIAGDINEDLSLSDLGRIKSEIENECLKDERVIAASATVTTVPAGGAGALLIITIIVTLSNGPFTLVLSVSALNTQIISISQ